MMSLIWQRKSCFFFKALVVSVLTLFVFSSVCPLYAQPALKGLNLPTGQILLSSAYTPPMITGISLYPDNPLKFDFFIHPGDEPIEDETFAQETSRLINYFLASLTVPEDEMWVNLSPYEKDRIIANGLSVTEIGRDMLAQDYLLKQLTASLMYPEGETGKEFWDKILLKAGERFGTIEISVDTYNKIWIIPERAGVYVSGTSVFVSESRLKVMLEDDYMALRENSLMDTSEVLEKKEWREETKQLVREVLLPVIEKEVNEGKNFANLRQIYQRIILATWYKRNLKQSILGRFYADQNKVKGIDQVDAVLKDRIYDRYVEAFRQGVFDFIREDVDPVSHELIPRRYFSGGNDFKKVPLIASNSPSIDLEKKAGEPHQKISVDLAMLGKKDTAEEVLKFRVDGKSLKDFKTVFSDAGVVLTKPVSDRITKIFSALPFLKKIKEDEIANLKGGFPNNCGAMAKKIQTALEARGIDSSIEWNVFQTMTDKRHYHAYVVIEVGGTEFIIDATLDQFFQHELSFSYTAANGERYPDVGVTIVPKEHAVKNFRFYDKSLFKFRSVNVNGKSGYQMFQGETPFFFIDADLEPVLTNTTIINYDDDSPDVRLSLRLNDVLDLGVTLKTSGDQFTRILFIDQKELSFLSMASISMNPDKTIVVEADGKKQYLGKLSKKDSGKQWRDPMWSSDFTVEWKWTDDRDMFGNDSIVRHFHVSYPWDTLDLTSYGLERIMQMVIDEGLEETWKIEGGLRHVDEQELHKRVDKKIKLSGRTSVRMGEGTSFELFEPAFSGNTVYVHPVLTEIKDNEPLRRLFMYLSVYDGLSVLNGNVPADSINRWINDAMFAAILMDEFNIGYDEIIDKLDELEIDASDFLDVLNMIVSSDPRLYDFVTVPQKVEAVADQIVDKILTEVPESGGIVQLDAPSGAGKTTVMKLVEKKLHERLKGTGRNVVEVEIDEFLKFRPWRQGVQKKLMGGELTTQEADLFGKDPVDVSLNVPYETEAWDFWRNNDIIEMLQKIKFHLNGDSDSKMEYTIKDAYDQKTKKYHDKTYEFHGNDIVLLAGKYSNLPEFSSFYTLVFRLVDSVDTISERFHRRTMKLSPQDAQWQGKFNQLALVPSWRRYEQQTYRAVDYFVHVQSEKITRQAMNNYRHIPDEVLLKNIGGLKSDNIVAVYPAMETLSWRGQDGSSVSFLTAQTYLLDNKLISFEAKSRDGIVVRGFNIDTYEDQPGGKGLFHMKQVHDDGRSLFIGDVEVQYPQTQEEEFSYVQISKRMDANTAAFVADVFDLLSRSELTRRPTKTIDELITEVSLGAVVKGGDEAMLGGSNEKGGIDFNPVYMNFEEDGDRIDFSMLDQEIQTGFLDIEGLRPVIINIVPFVNLSEFLKK